MLTASVMKSGNSAVIALPKKFRQDNDILIGDRVALEYSSENTLVIRPIPKQKDSRQALLADLLFVVDGAEPVPWDDDDADGARDILEERYA